jgi:hypothetical protein
MSSVLESAQKLLGIKKPDPKELVRKWQAELRTEQRKIDRQIRGGCPWAQAGAGRAVAGGR